MNKRKKKRPIRVAISDRLYRAMWELLAPKDFDLRNPYDKDLAEYLDIKQKEE